MAGQWDLLVAQASQIEQQIAVLKDFLC